MNDDDIPANMLSNVRTEQQVRLQKSVSLTIFQQLIQPVDSPNPQWQEV